MVAWSKAKGANARELFNITPVNTSDFCSIIFISNKLSVSIHVNYKLVSCWDSGRKLFLEKKISHTKLCPQIQHPHFFMQVDINARKTTNDILSL